MFKPFGYYYYPSAKSFLEQLYYRIFGLPFLSSHLVYRLIIKHVIFKKEDRILDYGTGDGVFLNQLSATFGVTGIGIDRLASRVALADKVNNLFELGNQFLRGDFSQIQSVEKFDKILCLDVLEHVENPEKEIKLMNLHLKMGGELIIQTPRDQDRKFILKDERFDYGHDRHIHKGFNREELSSVLTRLGFRIKYWQSDFGFFSQMVYEVLEVVRRRSREFYYLLWPIFYPLCLVDIFYNRPLKSNGLFIVAIKIAS